jgi:nucleoside-diphosphate-sugar epimerase
MRKVLLTGANGFIGRNLPSLLLNEGYNVDAVGRTPQSSELTTFHNIDLLNLDQAKLGYISDIGADTLIHSAWCVEPGAYWTSADNLRWVASSLQLLDAFVKGGGKRAVFVGTCAEYDWRYHTLIEGETPLTPSTLYGQAKASLNLLTSAFARQHNFSLAWAHVFFPYGPYDKRGRLVSDLICNLLNGVEIPVSEGRQVRDFLHIEDAAEALVRLAESDVQGPVNIGSGKAVPLRELIGTVASIIGRPELVKYGARPFDPNDPPCLIASTKRLQNEVGFTPRYTLEEGLRHTVEWWRQRQLGNLK